MVGVSPFGMSHRDSTASRNVFYSNEHTCTTYGTSETANDLMYCRGPFLTTHFDTVCDESGCFPPAASPAADMCEPGVPARYSGAEYSHIVPQTLPPPPCAMLPAPPPWPGFDILPKLSFSGLGLPLFQLPVHLSTHCTTGRTVSALA